MNTDTKENSDVKKNKSLVNDFKKRLPVIPPLEVFEGMPEKIFTPDWNNKPKERPAILSLNGTPILTYQNITSIIAAPGMGKSSIGEAAAASYLNPEADCLGLSVWPECKGVIFVDFERTDEDVWNSFYRLCKRAGIKQGDSIGKVKVFGMRSISRLAERKDSIILLLENNPCSLLILDGAGDMVEDTNDLQQAIEARIFFRELTVKYKVSILTTLHPNPDSPKPRGHIGSEILRESEGVFLLKKSGDYRLITSNFLYGKNRNNAIAESAYKWSDDQKMFVSVRIEEIVTKKDDKNRLEAESIAKKILAPKASLKHSDLILAIMSVTKKSDSSAGRIYRTMKGFDIIKQDPSNHTYSINID